MQKKFVLGTSTEKPNGAQVIWMCLYDHAYLYYMYQLSDLIEKTSYTDVNLELHIANYVKL